LRDSAYDGGPQDAGGAGRGSPEESTLIISTPGAAEEWELLVRDDGSDGGSGCGLDLASAPHPGDEARRVEPGSLRGAPEGCESLFELPPAVPHQPH